MFLIPQGRGPCLTRSTSLVSVQLYQEALTDQVRWGPLSLNPAVPYTTRDWSVLIRLVSTIWLSQRAWHFLLRAFSTCAPLLSQGFHIMRVASFTVLEVSFLLTPRFLLFKTKGTHSDMSKPFFFFFFSHEVIDFGQDRFPVPRNELFPNVLTQGWQRPPHQHFPR